MERHSPTVTYEWFRDEILMRHAITNLEARVAPRLCGGGLAPEQLVGGEGRPLKSTFEWLRDEILMRHAITHLIGVRPLVLARRRRLLITVVGVQPCRAIVVVVVVTNGRKRS